MTTRALVPNADGEGSLGVENLKWGAVYVSSPDKEDNSQKVPSTAWVQAIMAEARQAIMAEVYGGLSGTVLPTTAHVGQSFTLDRGDVSDGYERFVKYVCTDVTGGVPTWTTEFLLDPAHAVSTVLWTGTIATNPGDVYGGKWGPMPAGYTLIASGKGKDEFGDFEYIAGQKYGERLHRLTANDIEVVIDSIVHDGVTGTAFKRRSCRFENELFEAYNIYCVGGRVHVDAVIIGFNENDSRCSDFAV